MGVTLTKRNDENQTRIKKKESNKELERKENGIKRGGGEKEEEHAALVFPSFTRLGSGVV